MTAEFTGSAEGEHGTNEQEEKLSCHVWGEGRVSTGVSEAISKRREVRVGKRGGMRTKR